MQIVVIVMDTFISIHALLAESDHLWRVLRGSCRISIHALLAESDSFVARSAWIVPYFYPRSPCGERLRSFGRVPGRWVFLSTLSLRRATSASCNYRSGYLHFYPRSPCGERLPLFLPSSQHLYFYPRSPCGERRRF